MKQFITLDCKNRDHYMHHNFPQPQMWLKDYLRKVLFLALLHRGHSKTREKRSRSFRSDSLGSAVETRDTMRSLRPVAEPLVS